MPCSCRSSICRPERSSTGRRLAVPLAVGHQRGPVARVRRRAPRRSATAGNGRPTARRAPPPGCARARRGVELVGPEAPDVAAAVHGRVERVPRRRRRRPMRAAPRGGRAPRTVSPTSGTGRCQLIEALRVPTALACDGRHGRRAAGDAADRSPRHRARRPGGQAASSGTAILVHAGQAEAGAVAHDDAVGRERVAQARRARPAPSWRRRAGRRARARRARPTSASRSAAMPAHQPGRSTAARSSGSAAAASPPTDHAGWRARQRATRSGIGQHVAERGDPGRPGAWSAIPRPARRRPGSSARWPAGRRPRPTRRPSRRSLPAGRSGCAGSSATAGPPPRGWSANSGSTTRPPSSAATARWPRPRRWSGAAVRHRRPWRCASAPVAAAGSG